MIVKSKREEVGFVPITFSVTVETMRDLEDLWGELNEFECETLDGLFEHVSKRLEEETERRVAR